MGCVHMLVMRLETSIYISFLIYISKGYTINRCLIENKTYRIKMKQTIYRYNVFVSFTRPLEISNEIFLPLISVHVAFLRGHMSDDVFHDIYDAWGQLAYSVGHN